MGYPEMGGNLVWRSGLFSSVGRRVFSSQARSFAEGTRAASPVVMVVVVPRTLSLMALRSSLCAYQCRLQKKPHFHAMRKRKPEQAEETQQLVGGKKRGRRGSESPRASLEELALRSVTQDLQELFGAHYFSVKRAGD